MHYLDNLISKIEYRDGDIYWAETVNSRALKGDRCGSTDGKGYRHVCYQRKFYRVHRVIFYMHHGWLPDEVDHRDLDRSNNLIDNLRAANSHKNHGNSCMHSHNTSGYRGASFNRRSGKWHAQIKIHGKQTYLGRFDTAEEAARCYDEKAKEVFGEFATLNF